MPITLTLLGDVRWRGTPIIGRRQQDLLAALATGSHSLPSAYVADAAWTGRQPDNPVKAVQVLVSRVRTVCEHDAIISDDQCYRLGIGCNEVDALFVADQVAKARSALDSDPVAAAELASSALEASTKIAQPNGEIGRASCRERVYGPEVAAACKKREGRGAGHVPSCGCRKRGVA